VHGWIYELESGLLRDLEVTVDGEHHAGPAIEAALARPRLAGKAG